MITRETELKTLSMADSKTFHRPFIHGLVLAELACALTFLLTACRGPIPVPLDNLQDLNPLSTSDKESQMEALVAFYNSAGGPDWRNNRGWLGDEDPVGDEIRDPEGRIVSRYRPIIWHGVHVDYYTRVSFRPVGNGPSHQVPYVRGLILPGNGLTGEISPQLPGLKSLRFLDLRGNRLSGEIPPELGRMEHLLRIDLAGNQLTGEIPAELTNIRKLDRLILAKNRLTGEIPTELGDLSPQLKVLTLSSNRLTGDIPPELGSIRDLTYLDLRHNQLTGQIPDELGGFRQLHWLYLGGNQFTGCIPSTLDRITENDLLLLYLPMCDTGALPGDETRQTLAALYRSTGGNDWHDSTNWGNTNNIRWYGVSNQGSRAGPRAVTMLKLPENNLTGEIPPELGNLDRIRALDLSGNNLTGRIPPELGNLDRLIVPASRREPVHRMYTNQFGLGFR